MQGGAGRLCGAEGLRAGLQAEHCDIAQGRVSAWTRRKRQASQCSGGGNSEESWWQKPRGVLLQPAAVVKPGQGTAQAALQAWGVAAGCGLLMLVPRTHALPASQPRAATLLAGPAALCSPSARAWATGWRTRCCTSPGCILSSPPTPFQKSRWGGGRGRAAEAALGGSVHAGRLAADPSTCLPALCSLGGCGQAAGFHHTPPTEHHTHNSSVHKHPDLPAGAVLHDWPRPAQLPGDQHPSLTAPRAGGGAAPRHQGGVPACGGGRR